MSLLQGRAIAVTGAGGFIGRRLVARPVAEGADVRCISRTAEPAQPGAMAFAIPGYRREAGLNEALRGVDVVYHLAGRAHRLGVPESGEEEAEFTAANVDVARNVAQAAVASAVRRVVLVSSIGVHAEASLEPVRASDEPCPGNAYARTKLAGEHAVAQALVDGPTDFVVLRIPLVYAGDAPGNFGRLLRLVARAPIVPLAAVTAPRTLLACSNLVDALIAAADPAALAGRTFVLADDRDTCVAEIARELAAGMGRPPWVVAPVAPSLLGLAARLAGRAHAWNKISAPLRVDASAFRTAAQWRSPHDPAPALAEAGREFIATSSH